jgi:alpha-L-arabinofuranosidase
VKGKDLTLTLVHTHVNEPSEVSIQLRGARASEGIRQTVLTHEKLNAHNTFENPNQVMPKTEVMKASGLVREVHAAACFGHPRGIEIGLSESRVLS